MENWDPNEYQGRSKKQVEGNESIMATVLFTGAFIALVALIIKILF
jgi:hypothetical protein